MTSESSNEESAFQPDSSVADSWRQRILVLQSRLEGLEKEIERTVKEHQSRCEHLTVVEAEPGRGDSHRRMCVACGFEETSNRPENFSALLRHPIATLPTGLFVRFRYIQTSLEDPLTWLLRQKDEARPQPNGHGPEQRDSIQHTLDAAAKQREKYSWLFSPEGPSH